MSSLFLAAQNTNYFFKTLNAQRGATTCLDASGNLWVGTKKQGQIQLLKMRPDGTLLDRVDLAVSGSSNLVEMLVDTDGMIVGCGNSDETFGSGFAFRYDPKAHKLLWSNNFESLFFNIASGIMERGPGGHFTIVSTALFEEAEMITIDRLTGNLRSDGTRAHRYGLYKTYNAAVFHKGFIYTSGADAIDGNGQLRLSTSKIIPATGAVQWTRLSPRDLNVFKGDFIGQDIIVDQDSLVSISLSGPQGTGFLTNAIMQKNTLDGNLVWAKRYALFSPNERNNVIVEEVVSVSDGYVVFGRSYASPNNGPATAFFLFKTDKQGKPKWARLIGKNWDVGVSPLSYQNQLLATSDALYVIADAKNEAGQQTSYLLKTDLNGNIAGCDYIQTAGIQAFDLINPSNEAINVTTAASNVLVETTQVGPAGGTAPAIATLCEVKAACLDLPDAVLRLDSVTCGGGSRTAHFALCNVGSDTLFGDVALGFYPKNPLKDSTQRVALLTIDLDNLAPGACVLRSESLNALGLANYAQAFSLVGAADVPTPIALGSFPLGTAATECNYANNLTTWKLDVKGAAPKLGPDLSICPGKSTTLSTGTSAIGYRWQDGSTAATFTATAGGLYWVEITDACGVQQRDSVRVTILPTPTRSQTLKFVQGGTVTIGGTVYTQPGTVTLNVPSTTGGCDSLVTYTLEWVPAEVKIACPTDVVTAIPLGQNAATVNYALPTASTNCPVSALTINRLQGPASGSALGEGTVKVCYEATDNCNARSSCCFNVTVNAAPDPCESKTSSCLRYDLFSFLQDAAGARTYRLRVVNNCASAVQTIHFQLPSGAVAVNPANGSVYTAPNGRQYDVRNASATPFYSLRYKAKTSGIATGQSDYFEYKMPNQVTQAYFLAYSRLANGETYQAYLSTSNCPPAVIENLEFRMENAPNSILNSQFSITVAPNPTSGALSLRLPESWQGQSVRISVLNAQGQLVQEVEMSTADGASLSLTLDAELSRGLYYLLAQTPEGQRAAVRCVLK